MNSEIKFILPCEYASSDKIGRLNALGIFNNVKLDSPSIPKILTIYAVAQINLFGLEDPKVNIVLEILNESNEIAGESTLEGSLADFKKDEGNIINLAAKFRSVKFDKIGAYSIRIFVNKKQVGLKEDFIKTQA